MKPSRVLRASSLALLGLALPLAASQPANSERLSTPLSSPQEALKALQLPKGFVATLFASEPQIQNPIALSWDQRGRLWIAENYTYAEAGKRIEDAYNDRIRIAEDADWDGQAETITTFAEGLKVLTSIAVVDEGVYALCPPQLLYLPDRNHDDRPDGPAQVLLDGFEIAQSNHHNFANGLRMGADGWLYGRCGHSCPAWIGEPGSPQSQRLPMQGGIWRYHPLRRTIEVLAHGTTNPWGHDWDGNGEMFFVNSVTGHLWHLVEGIHLRDSNPSKHPWVYERLDQIADHHHFDTRAAWHESRDGRANALGGGHAHVGAMIYQATQWPQPWQGRLMTLNLHGKRINVERLERQGSGFVGRHEPEVMISTDPWFRGVELSCGPDGSVFVADWADIGECHENSGVHRLSGRIYRLSYGAPSKPLQPFSWRKPVPPADPEGSEAQRALAMRQLGQFWPLDRMDGQPHPKARAQPDAEQQQALANLLERLRSERSGLVLLHAAGLLQRLPHSLRPTLASALLEHQDWREDLALSSMIWNGLSPLCAKDPLALAKCVSQAQWPQLWKWAARALTLEAASSPQALNLLLHHAKPAVASDLLLGMKQAVEGLQRLEPPEAWPAFCEAMAMADPKSNPARRELDAFFGSGRAIEQIEALALDAKAEPAQRIQALQSLQAAAAAQLKRVALKLLGERNLALAAGRALAGLNDPELGMVLLRAMRQQPLSQQRQWLEILASRPSWTLVLLENLASEQPVLNASSLDAYTRQLLARHTQVEIRIKLERLGLQPPQSHAIGSTEALKQLATFRSQLESPGGAAADLPNGRRLFEAICAACHRLYGRGGDLGPDLTGSNRNNLDYLLENLLQPSAVVSDEYRLSVVALRDGRSLSGIVGREDAQSLMLRLPGSEMTFPKAEILTRQTLPQSLMPEGILQSLEPAARRDLIAYLMHPVQVAAPKR